MEYKGKQRRVPADKVETVKRAGGRVLELADPSSARDAAALGVAKAASFGNADVAAGLGAGLGAALAYGEDSDAGVTSGGEPFSFGEALRRGKGAYDEARGEHRNLEEASWEISPYAFGGGVAGGTLATAPLLGGPGSSATTLPQQVARGAAAGAAGGVGYGDADSVGEDLANAYLGATIGGVAPVVAGAAAPYVGRALGAGAEAAGPAIAKLRDLLGRGAGKVAAAGEALPPVARTGLGVGTGGASEGVIKGSRAVANKLNPLPPTDRGRGLAREMEAMGPEDFTTAVRDVEATVAPPAEVTTPGMESPVPLLDDAAELAGERVGPAIDNDAALAEVKAMLRARDEGLPFPVGDAARFRKTPPSSSPPPPPARDVAHETTLPGNTPPSAAEDFMSMLDDVDQGLAAPADDPLAAMRSEVAQDWGTRPPRSPQDFTGQPVAPNLPPPPPELVDFFLQKGATREQALAQAHAVMAKAFASPQGAVGRQRAAVGFDPASPGPAPIATPKGRNRAAAPFPK